MIAILCPTRARPEQCKRMVESARDTTKSLVRYYVGRTKNDNSQYELPLIRTKEEVSAFSPKYEHTGLFGYFDDEYPTAQKWNDLARLAKERDEKLFMLAADDMVFTTPGWDKAIIEHYNNLPEGRKQHVYALRDSRDENGTPHFIATREWINCMGWFAPPIFVHWFVDSWTVEIAKSAGCFTHFKDYELMHIKPSDQGQGDETHNRIREWGWRERDAYVARTCKDWLELQKQKLARTA